MCLKIPDVCIKSQLPRLGGLAIFIGFMGAMLVFFEFDVQMLSVLIGAMLIVVLGIFDDVLALGAKFKFIVQNNSGSHSCVCWRYENSVFFKT